MKANWRIVGLGCVAVCALLAARVGWASDDDDARAVVTRIEERIGAMRGPIHDAGRDQTDRALDKLRDADDKAKEVLSLADQLRGMNTTGDLKQVGVKHAEIAKAYLDAADGLKHMKAAEIRLRAEEVTKRCDDLNSKLKDFVEQIVSQKDHEGAQKIRDFADRQAGPIRESLSSFHGQDNNVSSSWNDQAQRFSASDKWSDVKSELQDARSSTRDGWKRLLEDADRGCDRIVKWDQNPTVVDGLRKLGDRARSMDDLRTELGRKLETLARLVSDADRKSSDSELRSALSAAEGVSDAVDKIKDVGGTNPASRTIADKWPAIILQFKDQLGHTLKMKDREYLVDRAVDRCHALENELLQLIKDLNDKAPIDQDREPFRNEAKEAAIKAATPIAEKLNAADQYEAELKTLNDQVVQFQPDDPLWRPVAKALRESALGIYEYYKGSLRSAHQTCDAFKDVLRFPAVRQALWGSCDEVKYNGFVTDKNNKCDRDRSCKGNNTNCPDLRLRRDMCNECWQARKAIMDGCFGGGDLRHEKEWNKAFTSVSKCDDELAKNKCP